MKKLYSLTPSGCGVFTQTHFLFTKCKTALLGLLLLLALASTSPAVQAQPMVLEYNTNLGAVGKTITLPLKGTVNVTVDWGDGSIEPFTSTGDKTHTYATNGIYTVSISGTLTGFGAYRLPNADKLVKIKDFGNIGLTDLSNACFNAKNLIEVPAQIPSAVTNLSYMFYNATSFNQDLSTWDVSKVYNMSSMFDGARAFNQPLSTWNVSQVTNMWDMFAGATSFNQALSTWNVSKVTDMSFMFYNAKAFNQDLSKWDVSKVTNMSSMFDGARAFNQALSAWNVSKVIDMRSMFYGATSFNQALSTWDVSKVTNMWYMFDGATAFNQDLSTWDVSNVTNMSDMFYGVTLSIANYDALLNGWSAKTLKPGVIFSGGNSNYSCASVTARAKLTSAPNSWVVTDGGSTCVTDIESLEHLTPLTVWPNPCVSHLYMSDDLLNKDYTIYTIDGALVMKGVTAAASIDVSALKQGLYLVLIDGAQFKVSKN